MINFIKEQQKKARSYYTHNDRNWGTLNDADCVDQIVSDTVKATAGEIRKAEDLKDQGMRTCDKLISQTEEGNG